jgi:hypothetical protein
MKITRKVSSAVALFLIAIQCAFVGTSTARAADLHHDLSATGTRAFTDLTRCINTKKALNVYYLVDESDSLKQTDPNQSRANILASSVRALGGFKGVNIKYAYGFFGDAFDPVKSWTQLTPQTADSAAAGLAADVKGRNKASNTNWQIGLEGAAAALRSIKQDGDACQALIWLTDGGLWLHEQNKVNTYDPTAVTRSAATLCNSTMESLRASNVSVLGVLLNNEEALAAIAKSNPQYYAQNASGMELMRPLVEGAGRLFSETGEARTCGTVPIPTNYSPGALLIAQDPIALALQFLILTSGVEGGTQVQIPGTNPLDFRIEPGVRKFRLLTTSSNWTLTNSSGTKFDSHSPTIDVQSTNGVSQITVGPNIPIVGSWNFNSQSANPTNRLILFSGLGITLNSGTLTAGQDGELSGAVTVVEGTGPVDLSLYGSHHFTVQAVKSDGSIQNVINDTITNDGKFKTHFKPDENQGSLELRASLTLTTKSGQALLPISISSWLTVKVPSDYPTVMIPVKMSKLVEKKGALSTGLIQLVGPKKGSGQVCFKEQANLGIVITRDSVNRKSGYTWKITDPLQNNCKTLASGESASVKLTVSNPTGADADVQASIPVVLKSDAHANNDIAFSAAIQLPTSLNRPGYIWWSLAIIILSILLPLALLYFLNWQSAKLIIGFGILRAVYKVRLDQNQGITDLNGSQLVVEASDFELVGANEDLRAYRDDRKPELLFTSHISRLPLGQPWHEVTPEQGGRIITMVPYPSRLNKRFQTGDTAPAQADLGNFWALVVTESQVKKAQERGYLEGELVIYKRDRFSTTDQYVDRVLDVVKTSGIWERFEVITQFASTSPLPSAEPWAGGSDLGDLPPPPPGAPDSFGTPPPGFLPPPPN